MKNSLLNTWITALSIVAIVGLWAFVDYQKSVDAVAEQNRTNEALQKELLLNSNCNHHVDSLQYINGELSKYQNLTLAMVHKNEALEGLKVVGDIVYMKSDSSRVVIEDVVIGGGKYNYYIKYRVIFKDDKVKEVSPEMIY
jgi:azurin